MLTYVKGEKFPHEINDGQDGYLCHWDGNVFQIFGFLTSPSLNEIEEFENGTFNIGIFSESNVPFIICKNQYIFFDAPINVLKLDMKIQNEIFTSESNTVSMVLVDCFSNIIKAIRIFVMPKDFFESLKNVLVNQKNTYEDSKSVDMSIDRIYDTYSLSNMLDNGKYYATIPRQS